MSKIAPRILGGGILAGLGYIAYNLFTDGFQEANSEGEKAKNENESILVEDTSTKDISSDKPEINNNNTEENNTDNNEAITEVSLDGIDIDNAVENESLDNKEETVESLKESTDTPTKNFIERVIQV